MMLFFQLRKLLKYPSTVESSNPKPFTNGTQLFLFNCYRDVSFNKLTGEIPATISAERLRFV